MIPKKLKRLSALAPTNSSKKDSDTLSRIDEFLKKQYNKPINYVQTPSHTPSSIGTKCFRKIYYQFFKVEKDIPTDAKGAKIFETGKFVEEMIMSWLKAIGEHIPYRTKTGETPKERDSGKPNPQFPIRLESWRTSKGFIDNVAIVDGKLWLYEIKSMISFKFQGLESPLDEHIEQTTMYFRAFNELLAAGEFSHISELSGFSGAFGVKIIYLNKDVADLKIFVLEKEQLEKEISKLDEKIKKANQYIDLKQLPPKTEDKCKWCPYIKKCGKEYNVN